LEIQNRANSQLRKFVLESNAESKIQKNKIAELEAQIEALKNKPETKVLQSPIELLSPEAQQNFQALQHELLRQKKREGLDGINFIHLVLSGSQRLKNPQKSQFIIDLCDYLLVENLHRAKSDIQGIPYIYIDSLFYNARIDNEKLKELWGKMPYYGNPPCYFFKNKFGIFLNGNFSKAERAFEGNRDGVDEFFNELFNWLED
jgi:hypothetical protein